MVSASIFVYTHFFIMRLDRIIVGEVRGAEALDMLQAMNTGHPGSLSTGHSNSARDMLNRLETMVLMGSQTAAGGGPKPDRFGFGYSGSSGTAGRRKQKGTFHCGGKRYIYGRNRNRGAVQI